MTPTSDEKGLVEDKVSAPIFLYDYSSAVNFDGCPRQQCKDEDGKGA